MPGLGSGSTIPNPATAGKCYQSPTFTFLVFRFTVPNRPLQLFTVSQFVWEDFVYWLPKGIITVLLGKSQLDLVMISFLKYLPALAMSSGASPLASPGMSPQGSPMADRRRPQSPGQLQANATSTPTSASQMASLTVCVCFLLNYIFLGTFVNI